MVTWLHVSCLANESSEFWVAARSYLYPIEGQLAVCGELDKTSHWCLVGKTGPVGLRTQMGPSIGS